MLHHCRTRLVCWQGNTQNQLQKGEQWSYYSQKSSTTHFVGHNSQTPSSITDRGTMCKSSRAYLLHSGQLSWPAFKATQTFFSGAETADPSIAWVKNRPFSSQYFKMFIKQDVWPPPTKAGDFYLLSSLHLSGLCFSWAAVNASPQRSTVPQLQRRLFPCNKTIFSSSFGVTAHFIPHRLQNAAVERTPFPVDHLYTNIFFILFTLGKHPHYLCV